MIVSCSQCGVKLKVDETKIKEGGSKLRCPKCQSIFTVYRPQSEAQAAPPPPPVRPAAPPPPPPPAPETPAPPVEKWSLDRRKVVVGHAGENVLKMITGILSQAGFETVTAMDGVHAMMEVEKHRPAVVVLDVGLPSIYGFEICDRLKNDERSKDVKVILIASIFDKTKYKREPMSLYGADDYIEKHHIQDSLSRKISRLLSPVPSAATKVPREEESFMPPPPSEIPGRQQQAEQMRRDEIKPAPAAAQADSQQVEAARRFARIILSDIALYNQSAVEEGIRNNNFQSLLVEELKEGRELYNSRVPADVRSQMDYFADEMEKFIEKKKQIMELGG